MRLQDLILHADKGQKVRYSITTLTDNCRGWVHDSPVMSQLCIKVTLNGF